MNASEEFDDLVRRKLNERRFEPAENDWRAAERLLRAQERRRRPYWPWVTVALVAITATVLVWKGTTDGPDATPAAVAQEQHTPSNHDGGTTELRSAQDTVNGPMSITITRPASSESSAEPASVARTVLPHRNAFPRNATPSGSEPMAIAHLLSSMTATTSAPRSERAPATRGDDPTTKTTNGTTDIAASPSDHTAAAPPAPPMPQTTASTAAPTTSTDPLLDLTTPTADQPHPDSTPTVPMSTSTPPPPNTPDSTTLAGATNTTDSSATPNVILEVKDSLSPQPILPPAVATASPWEIGLVLGGSYSRSTYQGVASETWSDGVRGAWTPQIGVEGMWTRGNFGIGTGVHHSSYQEHLDLAEERLTTTTLQDSSYFVSFDTTLLYVLGNVVIAGQTWFVTETRDTTIQKLMTTTITNTIERTTRTAYTGTHRVSYVEIPLLFDAHLAQGGWHFGVRGGPTVGLLTGRRGLLPGKGAADAVVYGERTFREMIFGATARMYVSRRFANGWSIGAGPSWRTQFGNALQGEAYTRRNAALGAYFSVSYRLP